VQPSRLLPHWGLNREKGLTAGRDLLSSSNGKNYARSDFFVRHEDNELRHFLSINDRFERFWRVLNCGLLAKHSPTMLLAHFIGDAGL
jgi:hypothetical protein